MPVSATTTTTLRTSKMLAPKKSLSTATALGYVTAMVVMVFVAVFIVALAIGLAVHITR